MAKPGFQLLVISLIFKLSLTLSSSSAAKDDDRKVYIAYLGSVLDGKDLPSSHHINMIQDVAQKRSVEDYLVRSYRRSFNGFAANLTDEEAQKLASMKGVISVFPNKLYQLQTTRSWDFMGFNETANHNATFESDVIVGVIDTGIWPESKSFSDEGFGPPPQKWKGTCNGGKNFTCNNKLIGAQVYITESARDTIGHGTHTASTATGNSVQDVSFFGLANGTARGGVPSARVAAYKVCSDSGCGSAEILAAFDDAIADGVDIITISIGLGSSSKFNEDVIAIGAFHADAKGILTTQSAGNSGSSGPGSVASVAPWLLTVAASTTDRLLIDKVVLGNGKTLSGFSINAFNLNGTKFPLVYGEEVAPPACKQTGELAMVCSILCLDKNLVKNKIVLCDLFRGIYDAFASGAAGSIALMANDDSNVSSVVPFPTSALREDDYNSIKSYKASDKEPTAEILKSETIQDSFAPLVAYFSSRGPNFIAPDILKPDISGPGVDILAAYSPVASPTDVPADKRSVNYNTISGTSISCPHVAGIAAYVKSFHPDWSPSAIKSAIMTTALQMGNNPDREFAYGSGHLNPVEAINPGLVYDIGKGDYIRFLCSIGYSDTAIRQISGDNSSCSETDKSSLPRDLNYPSLTAQVSKGKSFTADFHRTVTNVGAASSTYKLTVSSNSKLTVKVIPEVLSFNSLNEKKSYNVTVTGEASSNSSMVSASLVWSDGTFRVRSPIVIHTY